MRRWVSRRARQTHSRALVKTALYRVLMFLVTAVVALAVTRDPAAALNIGIAANIVKTGTYYGYERLWAHIEWGTTDAARESEGGVVTDGGRPLDDQE